MASYKIATPRDTQRIAVLDARRRAISAEMKLLSRDLAAATSEMRELFERYGLTCSPAIGLQTEPGGEHPEGTFCHTATGEPIEEPAQANGASDESAPRAD